MTNSLDSEIETGYLSINHFGEELCGDHIEITKGDNGEITFVLADGLGSGVQANILSTLTSSMLSKMIEGGLSIEESVVSIIKTLPVAKNRGNVAYSTFSIVKVLPDYNVEIYNYDNPEPICLRNGKEDPLNWELLEIAGKKIFKAETYLSLNDTIVLLSDGAIYAGVGETLNFGWTRKEIVKYLEGLYSPTISSKNLATLLVDHCDILYNRRPGDDTSSAVIRRRARSNVNLMVGPATNPLDDDKMMGLFFGKNGQHIVCGGTSAKVASRYLHAEVQTRFEYVDREIPPISHIAGVDLVTEGIITLNRLVQIAHDYLGPNKDYFDWSYKQDGASLLAKALFEDATDISFFVGCAVNPAHQDPRFDINISTKMGLVDELARLLKQMNKTIRVAYF
jgi:hypothetical protein